jgi:O-antigen/teichoic acid export membrane protein
MSGIHNVAKNTGVLFVSQIISYILGFFFIMYITRYLGPEEYGILSFALAFTTIFGIMADLGLSQFIVREISRDPALAPKYLGNALGIKIIASLLTFILAALIINGLNYPTKTVDVVYLIALYVLFNSFIQLFYSLFQSYEKMEYQAIGLILTNILLLVLALLGIHLNMDLVYFALVYFIVSLIILIYVAVVSLRKFIIPKIEFDLDFSRKVLGESLFFVLAMVFTEIYFNIDSVMISLLVGNTAVGFYNAAYKLIFILMFIPGVLVISMFPVMSKHFKSAKNLLKLEYERMFKYLFIIALMILVFGFIFADKIILIIYGSAFIPSISALQILICVIPIIFITYLSGNLLGSINKQRFVAIVTAASAVLNVILNLFLIPKFSYFGASVATVLTELCVLILMFSYISRFFHRISIIDNILKPLISAFVLATIISIINPFNWFLALLVGLIIYIPLLYMLKIIGKEDFKLLEELIRG